MTYAAMLVNSLEIYATRWAHVSVWLGKWLGVIGVTLMALMALLAIWRRRLAHNAGTRALQDAVQNDMHVPSTLHPEIDPVRCAGCGACVRACPEGEIIQLIHHRAVLVSPTKCVGHGECEVACPFAAISLVFGTKTRGMELPRISTNYETNVSGLYIVGELGGMGLIRNATKQGKLAGEHAVQTLNGKGRADVDVLIVGAGAAGLSAALAVHASRQSYACLEQGSVGGTIFNFPRQKIVMTHPAELPMIGTMKFPKNKVSKEELLAYWNEVRKLTGLKIREGCKFIDLKKQGDIFVVATSQGQLTASKVILAMGVRGTPRKLGVPGEDLAKVTYNLLDPEQYQRMHIAVVGGGNAAVEAAQYLARPEYKNRVTVLVRGKALDRANQENKDIITEMAKRGQLKMRFDTVVKEVRKDHIIVDNLGKLSRMPNSYLFIFAGAELPFKFLQELGIKIDKKFGEPLRKI